MKVIEWDDYLLNPPGVVGDVVKWIRESSGMYQPKFALAAGLTVCASLIGRAVRDYTGQRTNLYTLAVGRTSAGKNAPLGMVRRLVSALGQKKLIVGEACSASAIEVLLDVFPVRMFLLDEIGHYISTMRTAGQADVNLRTVIPALMKCWSCAGDVFCGKVRAKDQNGKWTAPKLIVEPCVGLYGATTPETLFAGMSSADFADGSIPRFLTFVSLERPCFVAKEDAVVPVELVEKVQRVLDAFGVKRHGSKSQSSPNHDDDWPTACLLRAGPGVEDCFADFSDFVHERLLLADKGDKVMPIWGKAVEIARRVALTVAAFRNYSDPSIGAADAEYAVMLVKQAVAEMVCFVGECVADTKAERIKKELLTIIRDCGRDGITKSELTRRTQRLRPTERNEGLEDLEEGGEIVSRRKEGKTKSILWYWSREAAQDPNDD